MSTKTLYGILGHPLGHSFSKGWFERRGYRFENFDCYDLTEFFEALPAYLKGFSVTIPYKEKVAEYLTRVDSVACEIGAINCVTVCGEVMVGYNTDVIGFELSLRPLLRDYHKRAAVLGSGGASKAVQWVLRNMNIDFEVISRANGGYDSLRVENFDIIINTTPLGMYPNVDMAPDIDYSRISSRSLCYDLIYNPAETLFLRKCRSQGCVVINGLRMLDYQAEAALRLYEDR